VTEDEQIDYALFVYIGGLCYKKETKQNESWACNTWRQEMHSSIISEGGQVDLYNNQYNWIIKRNLESFNFF